MQEKIKSHKDLIVWNKSINLSLEIYKITENFPKEEVYGLTSQIRRAAISIPSNIAEGKNRGTKKDFAQFLKIARGSLAELETQIIIAKQLPKTKVLDYKTAESLMDEIGKMLNVIIKKLDSTSS